MNRGTRIVLTAPFTEMIDHAGYFIQMGMASIPIWMEWVMDKKYPEWRNVKLFDAIKANPHRESFRVLRGGSGGWQITQRKSMERLGIDCVIDGRSESAETIALFHRAIEGGELPQHAEVDHPTDGNTLLFPDRPTTQVMPSKGVTETRNLSRLQWQLILRCWKLYAAGKLYKGQPIKVKTRAELLASIKPNYWEYLREDAGDIPAAPPPPAPTEAV